MLLTILEIIVFMFIATILGVLLGWLLRGALGSEQDEISSMRGQLRKLKKAKREMQAAANTKAETKTDSALIAGENTKIVAGKNIRTKPLADNKPSKPSKVEREAMQSEAKKEVAKIISRVGKSNVKDDLTKIHGVGPKYAAMLNAMGITSFEQVAKFKKVDVQTVAVAIGSFSGRVERDDWVAGAKQAIKAQK